MVLIILAISIVRYLDFCGTLSLDGKYSVDFDGLIDSLLAISYFRLLQFMRVDVIFHRD